MACEHGHPDHIMCLDCHRPPRETTEELRRHMPTYATIEELQNTIASELTKILGSNIISDVWDRRTGDFCWWKLSFDDIEANLHLYERLGVAYQALKALKGYKGDPRGFVLVSGYEDNPEDATGEPTWTSPHSETESSTRPSRSKSTKTSAAKTSASGKADTSSRVRAKSSSKTSRSSSKKRAGKRS